MQTIQLNIDDSVYDKFMSMLDIFPKDKIIIEERSQKKDFKASLVEMAWEKEAMDRLDAYRAGKLETVSEEEFFSYES